jgi:hypothetical protein
MIIQLVITTWQQHNPQEHNLNLHHCINFKSHKTYSISTNKSSLPIKLDIALTKNRQKSNKQKNIVIKSYWRVQIINIENQLKVGQNSHRISLKQTYRLNRMSQLGDYYLCLISGRSGFNTWPTDWVTRLRFFVSFLRQR